MLVSNIHSCLQDFLRNGEGASPLFFALLGRLIVDIPQIYYGAGSLLCGRDVIVSKSPEHVISFFYAS